MGKKATRDQEFETVERCILPSLPLKSVSEGDSIIVKFGETFTEKKKRDKDGNESDEKPMIIARCFDMEDGIEKEIVMPFMVFQQWEKIKGKTVRLTRGPLKNRCVMWEVDIVKLKK